MNKNNNWVFEFHFISLFTLYKAMSDWKSSSNSWPELPIIFAFINKHQRKTKREKNANFRSFQTLRWDKLSWLTTVMSILLCESEYEYLKISQKWWRFQPRWWWWCFDISRIYTKMLEKNWIRLLLEMIIYSFIFVLVNNLWSSIFFMSLFEHFYK